jgi:hypothetical protein
MKKSELLERLHLLKRRARISRQDGARIFVYDDEVEAVEAAIKLIEGIEGEEE